MAVYVDAVLAAAPFPATCCMLHARAAAINMCFMPLQHLQFQHRLHGSNNSGTQYRTCGGSRTGGQGARVTALVKGKEARG